jgi:hypothetical protein
MRFLNESPKHAWLTRDLKSIAADFYSAVGLVPGFDKTMDNYKAITLASQPSVDQKKTKSVTEELRVQLVLEERWENLVRTLSVEAGDQSSIFTLLKLVIEQAAYDLLKNSNLPQPLATPLPPQFEQSLQAIARRW